VAGVGGLRAVSYLIAVLVALGIMVGIAVAVATYLGIFTQRMQYSSGTISVQGVRFQMFNTTGGSCGTGTNKCVFLAEITYTVGGSASAAVTGVDLVMVDSSGNVKHFSPTWSSGLSSWQNPGSTGKVTVRFEITDSTIRVPVPYSTVRLIIYFQDITGRGGSTAAIATVEPPG